MNPQKDTEKALHDREIAGTSHALGDALAYVRANAGQRLPEALCDGRALGLSPEILEREAREQGQKDALLEWAKAHGMMVGKLPAAISAKGKISGAEHDAYPTDHQRWLKVTHGLGLTVSLDPHGELQLEPGCVLSYLQRLQDKNDWSADDIRLHGVLHDGDDVRVITSQPDLSHGDFLTEQDILEEMTGSRFQHLGGGAFYRKSDNRLVVDFKPENGSKPDGLVLAFDVIVLPPDAEMVKAIKEMRFSALVRGEVRRGWRSTKRLVPQIPAEDTPETTRTKNETGGKNVPERVTLFGMTACELNSRTAEEMLADAYRRRAAGGADTPERSKSLAKPPKTAANSVSDSRMVISWFACAGNIDLISETTCWDYIEKARALAQAWGLAIERLGNPGDLIFGSRMRSITREEFFEFEREWEVLNNQFEFRFSGGLWLMPVSGQGDADLPKAIYSSGSKRSGGSTGIGSDAFTSPH